MKFTKVETKSKRLDEIKHFPIITGIGSIIFRETHPESIPKYFLINPEDTGDEEAVEVLPSSFVPYDPRPINIIEIKYELL